MNEVGQIRQDCHICGTPLEYLEQGIPVRCTVCGREERGNVLCPEGHYVCEACHSPDFLTSLRTFLRESSETSPFLLAEELMDHHALPMLGCEHAHIAAGALMTALRNSEQAGVDETLVDEVLARPARQAVSAYCGLSGVCGVVTALGACYSVLVGARCGLGPPHILRRGHSRRSPPGGRFAQAPHLLGFHPLLPARCYAAPSSTPLLRCGRVRTPAWAEHGDP